MFYRTCERAPVRVVRIMADALHELVESVWTDGFQHLCVLSLHTLLAENLIKVMLSLRTCLVAQLARVAA